MTPLLFDGATTDFGGNFICALTECLSCEVTENADTREFECAFSYPTNGALFKEIQIGRIIYVPHDATRVQEPLDIYAYDVGIDGIATFRAHHVSYRLAKQIRKPRGIVETDWAETTLNIIIDSSTTADAGLNLLATPFHVISAEETPGGRDIMHDTLPFGWNGLRSSRDLLIGDSNSIASTLGFEFKWEKFNIRVYSKTRGRQRDVIIRYGRNVSSMTYEQDANTTYRAIMPYWVDSQTGETVYFDGNGSFIDPDTGNPVADTATIAVGINELGINSFLRGDTFEAVPVDFSGMLDERPTDFQLWTVANEYFDVNATIKPFENLTVDFADVEPGSADAAQQLCLCDLATVYMPQAHIAKNMRVAKTTYDALRDRYTKLEFGNAQRSIYTVDTLKLKNTADQGEGTITIVDEDIEV